MNNLWDEEDPEFRDRPEETQIDSSGQPMHSPQVQVQNVASPVLSNRPSNIPAEPTKVNPAKSFKDVEFTMEELEELYPEDDFSDVLNDANLRIEQGRLYQMIMNHDLFAGMDSEPKAVQNVQREIRQFAKERMEIMLGMRRETAKVESLEIDFPFNAVEVDVLKKLAFAATKGASENSDRFVPEVRKVTEEIPTVPRKTLNPINGYSRSSQPKTAQKLQNKPSSPVNRKRDFTVEQILQEEGVSRELIEENYKPIGKPLNELSEQELTQRAKETAQRLAKNRTVKSSSALPMATPEQEAMLAVQRATQVSQAPGMAALLAKVSNMPAKNP